MYKEQTEQDNKCRLVHCGKKLTRTPSYRSSILRLYGGVTLRFITTRTWDKHCVTHTCYSPFQLSKDTYLAMK